MWLQKRVAMVYGFSNDRFFCPRVPFRDQIIISPYSGRRLAIPTGKKAFSRRIDSGLEGYKFGDFAPTRRPIPKPAARPKMNRSGRKKTGKK